MDATASEGERLTPQTAAAEIRRIENLHDALGRRASGLTWMIWALVAPAIFISYDLAAAVITGDRSLFFLYPTLWIPWAALGLAATVSLWRSVGLVVPIRSARLVEGAITAVVIVGLIFGGFIAISVMGGPVSVHAWILMGYGGGLALVGVLGLNCYDRADRRFWIVGGLILVLVAVGGTLLSGGDVTASNAWFIVLAPLSTALVLFSGGWILSTRA